MGDIKQTNFRIDQDTADAFRRFCEENGMNQAQGFDHIMQVVELDRAKAATPSRATEIEGFEKSVKDIMAAYLYSIEINNNAEARIREQFSSSLDRKDKTISDLQVKAEELQAAKIFAEAAQAEAEKAQATAEEREKNATEQMDAAKKTVADQERINAMLTAQLADATGKLDGYDTLRASVVELREKLAEMERILADQKKAAETNLRQAQIQAELATERAVMSKEREMNEMLRQTDKENAKLTARIEQMQAQIDHLTALQKQK